MLLALILQTTGVAVNDINVQEGYMNSKSYQITKKSSLLSTAVVLVDNTTVNDTEGDTFFRYCDILYVQFYEVAQEPDYLYIKIQFQDLRWRWRIERTVGWTFNDVNYFVYHKVWALGFEQGNVYTDDSYSSVEFSYDPLNGHIIWKIPKDFIGNPIPGDALSHTQAFAGFEPSYLIGGGLVLFADYAPDNGYGSDYIIQY